MLKPSQAPTQSHREPTAINLSGNHSTKSSTNYHPSSTNHNQNGNTNPQGSNAIGNGLANGRVSNVSFASYDKVGSIDQVVDEDQHQLLADKATPLKTTANVNAAYQPTTINKSQPSLEQTLTLLQIPIDASSISNEEINVSLLNGMFSSMGSHRRPINGRTSTVRNGGIDGGTIEVSSNLSGTERVNDIYVNRNVAALYNSSVQNGVGQKTTSKTIPLSDDPFSGSGYNGFYLHGTRVDSTRLDSRLTSDLSDTKVYNAFSRKLRPEASALTLKQTPVRSWDSLGKQKPISFEDDELTNILG